MRSLRAQLLLGAAVFGCSSAPAPEVFERPEPSVREPYVPPAPLCTEPAQRRSPRACGYNGRGVLYESCVGGEWLLDVACADADECIDGTRREEAESCGGGGRWQHTCRGGSWDPGSCLEPQGCSPGAARVGITPCGLNGRGRLEQTCHGGDWRDSGTCADPDVCRDGLERGGLGGCGLNGRGTPVESCSFGQWQLNACDDPDLCLDGRRRNATPCSEGGWSVEICDGGAWVPLHDCEACGSVVEAGDVRLLTNDDVQALAGVSWVVGHLSIGGVVSSLAGLEELRCVGSLTVENADVVDVAGLTQLTYARVVTLIGNPHLTGLDGLDGPVDFEVLRVQDNPALTRLGHLSGRTSEVWLTDLPALASLDGMSGLYGESLHLQRLAGLTTLDGVEGSRFRTLDFRVVPALRDISALAGVSDKATLSLSYASALETLNDILSASEQSLQEVSLFDVAVENLGPLATLGQVGVLRLERTSVTDLDALSGLREVAHVVLTQNPHLVSIAGLNGVERLQTLELYRNPRLVDLGAFDISDMLHLRVSGQDALTSLDAFSALQRMRGLVSLIGNAALTRVDFPSLARVDSSFSVQDNPLLEELVMPELLVSGRGVVQANPRLPSCLVERLLERLRSRGGGPAQWVVADTDPAATCD